MARQVAATMALLAVASPSASNAVPTPPPSFAQENVAKALVRAFNAKDVEGYGALLADDVQVFEDGKQVASTKAEWLGSFGPKLSAKGIGFKLFPGYIGAGRILFVEYFASHGSGGKPVPGDCCDSYDAVSYALRGDRIVAIYRIVGGSLKLDQDGIRSMR